MTDGKTILFAAGDRDLTKAISRSLKKNGYAVDVVNDGAQAVNAINNKRYDLFISSRKLARVSDVEVAVKFRIVCGGKIIIISDLTAVRKGSRPDVDCGDLVLEMPFTEQALLDCIDKALYGG